MHKYLEEADLSGFFKQIITEADETEKETDKNIEDQNKYEIDLKPNITSKKPSHITKTKEEEVENEDKDDIQAELWKEVKVIKYYHVKLDSAVYSAYLKNEDDSRKKLAEFAEKNGLYTGMDIEVKQSME
jgi:hypothetical protein